MKGEPCRFESQVIRAAERGEWTTALRNHVASCDDCSAAVAVAPWMERLAAEDVRDRPLPDPAVVWMKAQLLRGSVAIDRATRPLRFAHMAGHLIVAAGWAALLMWKWTAIQSWVSNFSPARIVTSAAQTSFSVAFVGSGLLLFAATITLALHTILAEE